MPSPVDQYPTDTTVAAQILRAADAFGVLAEPVLLARPTPPKAVEALYESAAEALRTEAASGRHNTDADDEQRKQAWETLAQAGGFTIPRRLL